MEFNIEDYLNSLPLDTTSIDVSYKGLTYLPDLSRFKQLTHLYCNHNQLTYLPETLGNCSQLQSLECYDNQLTELPETLGNCSQLWCLDFHNNQLTWLPESLGEIEELTKDVELPYLSLAKPPVMK